MKGKQQKKVEIDDYYKCWFEPFIHPVTRMILPPELRNLYFYEFPLSITSSRMSCINGFRNIICPNNPRQIIETKEPLFEVIESDETVSITSELIGVLKENIELKTTKQTNKDSNKKMSSFDVIKNDNEVTITIDMPDTKKEEINLRITKGTIEIMPNNPEGKYHRLINLPCNVKSKTATFTYRNGILDIIITREKEEK